MGRAANEHRRERAWAIAYVSRLNVCYWKKILKLHEDRSLRIRYGLPVFCLAVTLYPVIKAITWNPAIITALVSFGGSTVGIAISNSRSSRIKGYCRQWSELAHDAERLWQEGEALGWGRQQVIGQIERLDTRLCKYQVDELDHPNREILFECEAQLYNELGVRLPPEGDA